MMKIKIDKYESTYVYQENCKNTKDDEGWKKLRCVCGCTRIEAKVASREGEGAGDWLQIECKKCHNTLYYNGA